MDLVPVDFDLAEDDSAVFRASKVTIVGEGVPDDEADAYIKTSINTFLRWNGKCMYQPISRCVWREIPASYIYTTIDMIVTLDYQNSMVQILEKEGRPVKTYKLQSGHYPNLMGLIELWI
ncbi:hypothetical protein DTO271G3_6211 [Paecilomyces variotii]|nr:hypothetical protein DTO271G3_6211 [Paecilomyces variotii]